MLFHCNASEAFPRTEPYLKGELVFLPVVEGDVLGHHLPQVVLHKLHGEAKALLDLIPGRSVVVVAG